MHIFNRIKKTISIMLIISMTTLLIPIQSYAMTSNLNLDQYLTGLRSAGYLTNGGASIKADATGARAVGGLSIAFPPETSTEISLGYNMDFNFSCAGMDFNAEAFAHIDANQILNWLKQVLTSMAFAYILTLSVGSSTLGDVMTQVEGKGQFFSQLLQSPCELGSTFGTLAEKGSLGAVGDCISSSVKSGFDKDWYSAMKSCSNNKISAIDAAKKDDKSFIQICRDEITMGTHADAFLAKILGNGGLKHGAGGVITITPIPESEWGAQINELYKARQVTILTIINKIKNDLPLSTTERSALDGPMISLYDDDLRAIKILSVKNPDNASQLANALATAMAIGELNWAVQRISQLLTRCIESTDLDEGGRGQLLAVQKQMEKSAKQFTENTKKAKIQESGLAKIRKSAMETLQIQKNKSTGAVARIMMKSF